MSKYGNYKSNLIDHDKIIKLNKELTAENTRLLEELEKYNKQTKIILTIGTIVIFSLAILAILSKWLGVW